MRINVETKYDVGQEVYRIGKVRKEEICSACNGEGYIKINNNVFSCNTCSTTGKICGEREQYQIVGKDTIKNISVVNYLYNGTRVRYGFDMGITFTENRLFETQEAAEEKCKELNRENI